ncbi:hypothetical protein F5X96DRAFT_693821 [Biscogniauxia mediterranea]|nr:hypothetical protein F5X96DRAFT_693821 [Biscogniauxia mediterranea]
MRYSRPFLLLFLPLLGSQAIGPLDKRRSDSNFPSQYIESNITWTGKITEDGPILEFTGSSLQHIEAQIRRAHPSFSGWSPLEEPRSPAQVKREKDFINCEPPGAQYASSYWIVHAIDYLRGIKGNCTNGPGPANCGRISCSWNSGIWWCNDDTEPKTVDCSLFASYVADIVERCYNEGRTPDWCVMGQEFDCDKWNVIVAGTKDWC